MKKLRISIVFLVVSIFNVNANPSYLNVAQNYETEDPLKSGFPKDMYSDKCISTECGANCDGYCLAEPKCRKNVRSIEVQETAETNISISKTLRAVPPNTPPQSVCLCSKSSKRVENSVCYTYNDQPLPVSEGGDASQVNAYQVCQYQCTERVESLAPQRNISDHKVESPKFDLPRVYAALCDNRLDGRLQRFCYCVSFPYQLPNGWGSPGGWPAPSGGWSGGNLPPTNGWSNLQQPPPNQPNGWSSQPPPSTGSPPQPNSPPNGWSIPQPPSGGSPPPPTNPSPNGWSNPQPPPINPPPNGWTNYPTSPPNGWLSQPPVVVQPPPQNGWTNPPPVVVQPPPQNGWTNPPPVVVQPPPQNGWTNPPPVLEQPTPPQNGWSNPPPVVVEPPPQSGWSNPPPVVVEPPPHNGWSNPPPVVESPPPPHNGWTNPPPVVVEPPPPPHNGWSNPPPVVEQPPPSSGWSQPPPNGEVNPGGPNIPVPTGWGQNGWNSGWTPGSNLGWSVIRPQVEVDEHANSDKDPKPTGTSPQKGPLQPPSSQIPEKGNMEKPNKAPTSPHSQHNFTPSKVTNKKPVVAPSSNNVVAETVPEPSSDRPSKVPRP